jgi:arginine decarboxylase-like protein
MTLNYFGLPEQPVEAFNYFAGDGIRNALKRALVASGDTNAVHVSVDENGYSIDKIIDGETIADVLDYVQYDARKLVRTLERWVTSAVKEGRISLEEGKEFLSNYRSGLYGYTYLDY